MSILLGHKARRWVVMCAAILATAALVACGGWEEDTEAPTANPADYLHAAGLNFDVVGGATAPFYCQGPRGATYQWLVESNGGLPIGLSSYNTQSTSFTAPVVTQSTPIVLICRMTLSATSVINSRVTATLQPAPVTPAAPLTLVSGITGNKTVLPGQRLALSATATWYDEHANAVSGPLVSYVWSLDAGAPAGIAITPLAGSKDVEVIIPSTISTAVFVPVTVKETSGDKSSSTTVSVLVDPNGDLNVTLSPAAQSVTQGSAVSITANSSSSTKLYYQWTVVNGPTVTLGGATSSSVGFVAPSVAVEMVLRVAIGYAPITTTNPGVYFLQSVVTVQ